MEGDTSMDAVDNILNDIIQDTSPSNNKKVRKKRCYTERKREEGHERIWNDYFSSNPVYNARLFRRRFRMRKELFLRIVNALENHSDYFTQRVDALGRSSLTPLQKCVAAIRLLAYGVTGDAVDEYVRIGGNTVIQCLKKLCKCVIEIFEAEYLRRPTVDDIQRLLQTGEAREFPGSNNDINVLDRSPIFDELLEGRGPEIPYTVNGSMYNIGYYLADGIYPEWPVFVKSIPRANMLFEKRKLFSQYQEGARKDIERAFGVLQKRFAIVCNPVRLWDKSEVGDIMKACIILHKMIIEDERDDNEITLTVEYTVSRNQNESPQLRTGLLRNYYANRSRYFENHTRIRNQTQCHQLQHDLMEHIWSRFGENTN